MALDRPDEAARRFHALLDLHRDDDEVSAIVTAKRKNKAPAAAPASGRAGGSVVMPEEVGITARMERALVPVRAVSGLLPGISNARVATWAPMDFGLARMVALGSLLVQAQRENGEEAFLARLRQARTQAPNDQRTLWDTFYLGLIRLEPREVYEAARALARFAGHEPSAGYVARCDALSIRDNPPGRLSFRLAEDDELDVAPPLPPEEIDLVRDAFISVARTNPSWLESWLIDVVLSELRCAGRAGRPRPVLSRAGRRRQRPGHDRGRRLNGRRPRRPGRSVDALRGVQQDPAEDACVGVASGILHLHTPGINLLSGVFHGESHASQGQRQGARRGPPTPRPLPGLWCSPAQTALRVKRPRRHRFSPGLAVPLAIPASRSRTLGHVV